MRNPERKLPREDGHLQELLSEAAENGSVTVLAQQAWRPESHLWSSGGCEGASQLHSVVL